MKDTLLKLSIKLQNVKESVKESLKDEQGQDLIEYALVVALIAFAATAGMHTLAGGINTAFSDISTTLASYIS